MSRRKKHQITTAEAQAQQDQLNAHILWARYWARTDLKFLCKDILGYPDLSTAHDNLFEWEVKSRAARRRLFLMPRGHLKSSILTIGGTIQHILRTHGRGSTGEEWDIAIGSWDMEHAYGFIGEIQKHFEHNEKLRYLFDDIIWKEPEAQCKADKLPWGKDGITLMRKRISRYPTITPMSVEALITSRHVRRIVWDDAVSRENSRTPEMRKKVIEAVNLSSYLLTYPSSDGMDIIGTRYDLHDLYGHLTAHAYKEFDAFQKGQLKTRTTVVYIRKAIENGKPIWPERFTMASLEAERLKDPVDFACQMQNDPTEAAIDSVDINNLRYYEEPPALDKLTLIARVDPAVAQKQHADYTSATVWGFDEHDNAYLMDGIRDRLGPAEFGPTVAAMLKQWARGDGLDAKVESNGFQAYCRMALEDAGCWWVGEYKTGPKISKIDRIRKIIPRISTRRMFLPKFGIHKIDNDGKPYDLVQELISELKDFPQAEHDDLLDTVAQCMADRIVPVTIQHEKTRDECYTTQELIQWEIAHPAETFELLQQGKYEPDFLFGEYASVL